MLSTARPVRVPDPVPIIDHHCVEMNDDQDELESETSQEYYPESEDEDGQQEGAKTMYHAPRSDCDTANSTRSLFESDIEYTFINGRRYCDEYYLPNDLREQERWQMMHQLYLNLFEYCLTTVPLTVEPRRILDIGCATGDWCLDMATVYPDAEIIGTDIAPIQPTHGVPQNVFFEIDDAEIEGGWNFGQGFDLIHIRSMKCAFKSWTNVYKEAWKHLNPGGWIEIMDFDDNAAILEFFNGEPIILEWYAAFVSALEKSGRPATSTFLEKEALLGLGFVEVESSVTDMKMGAWGPDRGLSGILLKSMVDAVEGATLRPLVEHGGYEVSEVEELCGRVREAATRIAGCSQTAEGCTFKVKVLRGRKPEEVVLPLKSVNGNGKGFLSPSEKDTDRESVATIKQQHSKTNGYHI